MNMISVIGRIIFGGYFLYSGVNHFLSLADMTGYAESKGVPMPSVAVIVSGLLLLIGGALILLGWKVRWGAWMIVFFLIPVSFMMHDFWTISDQQQRMSEMINFSKNMAMAGAALMISSYRYWPFGLEKPGEAGRETAPTL